MKRNSPFVEIISEKKLKCMLCPHACVLSTGKHGKCGTRINDNGQLSILTYGQFDAIAIDPIEKKPLSHFFPGSRTFSVGTAGCNMVCSFCQNDSLSQRPVTSFFCPVSTEAWSPEDIVAKAVENNCHSIAFTYSEPTLSVEFALAIAPMAAAANLGIVFVTNGQINTEPLSKLCPHLAAANVDLKSFQPHVYKDKLGGDLSTTLNTIQQMHRAGVWVEITTLLVPGMNDTKAELSQIARFIAQIDKNIPWHISRFRPAFQETSLPPTTPQNISAAVEIGIRNGLRYVYAGNLPGQRGENTYCPNCQDVVVHRVGYDVLKINTLNKKCIHCGCDIAGVGFP